MAWGISPREYLAVALQRVPVYGRISGIAIIPVLAIKSHVILGDDFVILQSKSFGSAISIKWNGPVLCIYVVIVVIINDASYSF